ncbi:MAG: TraR/DksA family transcriptional regulator [Thermodesulfobacteriota bacterium]
MELDMSFYRSLLEKKGEEIRSMLEGLRESVRPVTLDQTTVGRLSRMDAMQGQAMALAVERRRKQELKMITTALKRMDDGEYGYCLNCGDAISPRRLEFNPAVLTCIDCAGKKP